MLNLRDWTMRRKLWATLILMWVGLILVAGWSLYSMRANLFEQRTQSLEYFIGSAKQLVDSYVDQAQQGKLSEQEAKQRAIAKNRQSSRLAPASSTCCIGSNLYEE